MVCVWEGEGWLAPTKYYSFVPCNSAFLKIKTIIFVNYTVIENIHTIVIVIGTFDVIIYNNILYDHNISNLP